MVPELDRCPSTGHDAMTPRRRFLLATGAAASMALAGCTGSDPDSGDDPDAGRDSYGVLLENDLDAAYTVSLRGEAFVEHETVWEETVEIGAGETREWEELFTEPIQYMLYASVESDDFPEYYRSDNNSVNVGKESSPLAENVRVFLRMTVDPNADSRSPVVRVQPPGDG